MQVKFEQLITGFCDLAGHACVQQILDGGGITIEHVTFALVRKHTGDPAALFLYADFGQFDLAEQAALYPLILQENMRMFGSRECTFSVSATRDSVVMIEKIRWLSQTPETLLAHIYSITRKANYFNKPHRGGNIRIRHRFTSEQDSYAQGQPRARNSPLR